MNFPFKRLGTDRGTFIPMSKCKDGHLYIIDARNANLGVYVKKERGFRISRHKFQCNFIDIEYHWDTGEPHGTVKPLSKLNYLGYMPDEKLLDQLKGYMKTLMYDIKSFNLSLCAPIEIISSDRMKQLRMLQSKCTFSFEDVSCEK